ncbi:hypothetical protein [Methanocella conradii]|uniref:hypothetical protein n=1 Tax=Methanocella conradii TaxID=1175444 RepID=UPI0024B32EF6|nr:hypothetical protein [Methanocella conradii]MDI6897932.1 hypothetical protein [Methanocella conradii]
MRLIGMHIAALLASILIISTGSTILGPSFSMFSAPTLSLSNAGFNQISPSEAGNAPVIFAPTSYQLLHGGSLSAHFKPRLLTDTWTPSMKASPVNQMFAVLAHGIGNYDVP